MKLDSLHIVDVSSEIVIAGTDPEMSDMDNPEGYIHKIVYFVTITDCYGLRIRHCRNFNSYEEAYGLATKIFKFGEVNLDYWDVIRPAYGSMAYEENIEEELMLEKKEEEMY